MPKSKRKPVGTKAPATKADVEHAIDRLARVTEKAFQKVVTKDQARQFLTKEDAKQFATKTDLAQAEDRIVKRVVHEIQADREKDKADLEEVHQDQLDIVAGKKDASPAWKSIPRRLNTVEQDVEHIKGHLHLPSK